MSDVRTEVAQAIWLRHTHQSHKTMDRVDHAWKIQKAERPERVDDFLLMADQAIAAATPHIRAAVIDELIAEAEQGDMFPFGYSAALDQDLVEWIKSHKTLENQP